VTGLTALGARAFAWGAVAYGYIYLHNGLSWMREKREEAAE
jgi:hypothetical protein